MADAAIRFLSGIWYGCDCLTGSNIWPVKRIGVRGSRWVRALPGGQKTLPLNTEAFLLCRHYLAWASSTLMICSPS